MNEQLEISLELVNDRIQFRGAARDNEPVMMDYFPPLGDGKGYTGLELLLVSFAGCSSTSIVYLLRKMSKTVSGLKVSSRGERKEKPPLSFSKIFVEYIITSEDVTEGDMEKAIKLSEESVCPVWNMIKGSVEIYSTFKINSLSLTK
jgi:putative redox protein